MEFTSRGVDVRYCQGFANQEAPVMARKRYSPKLKLQVVLGALAGEKTPGQIGKEYGIHQSQRRAYTAKYAHLRESLWRPSPGSTLRMATGAQR